MLNQSRLKFLKSAASILAIAGLAACSSGGSGGGSAQPAGEISVKNPVTIDDVITVEFTGCGSKGFKAELDGIEVTSLFSLDKSNKDKACKARASVYALQGILGEKAQAEGSSKLTVKVSGRSDINKSFKFKAWPEIALGYENYNDVKGSIYNALLSSKGGTTADSGIPLIKDRSFEVGQPDYPLVIELEATNGLKNKFTLAVGGQTIDDSSVLQLPQKMDSSHIVSEWVASYLDVDTVAIEFDSECNEKSSLCSTIIVGDDDYEVNIGLDTSKTSFEIVVTGEEDSVNSKLETLIKAFAGVLLMESDSTDAVSSEVKEVRLTPPALISVSRSIKYYNRPASYFAQTVGDVEQSFDKTDRFYIAATSNEINQRLLAETLLVQYGDADNRIEGEIPLCDGNDCTLRDELIKLATPAAEEMAQAIGLISAAEARKLLENILTKDQKINYQVVPTAAPPYTRFLSNHLELSAYNVFLVLKLSEPINANTVCGKVFTGLFLTGCKSELPSGTYQLQLGDIALKQRVLVKDGEPVVSDLIETSIHLNKALPVVNNYLLSEKTAVAWAMSLNLDGNGKPRSDDKIGALDSKTVLPVLFGALGQLPIDEVSNFKLADLTQSGAKVEIDCDADSSGVLSDFIGDEGKKLSFKDSELKLGKATTDSDTKEAKHLILSGDMIKTPNGATPDVTIACK